MTRASVLSALLLLALCPNAALAWLRSTHEDATVVERSELIVVARLKPGSILKVPHDTPPGAGVSWEHHATLVISTVLKGTCDKKEIPVIVHYGLTPVELTGAKGGIEIFDTGSSARGGGSLVKDAGRDNLWFLRKRSGTFGREPGTGDYGVVDPEDVQPLELKPYVLCYLGRDPEAAVKAFAVKNPAVAERSKRYLDHLDVQRALKIENMGKRYDALLPFFLARTTWNMKEEATEALVACGATAGEGLKDVFTDPRHRAFRSQIIRMWRDMKYREIAPVLISLLKEHDRFWAAQDLKKGWWGDDSKPELTRRRQDVYGEVYAAAYTLRAFRDPGAKDVLELTRTRWAAINFDNKQIVEECEAALRELSAKADPVPPAADNRREAAIALKVALDGDKATVTVAFNYTGKPGDPPTFQGVRMYKYELLAGKGPTRVGWEGTEGKQTVVVGGKRYSYYPTLTDRTENGTLSVSKADGGKLRLTGVYHYDGILFVVDETLKPGDPVLLEAVAHGVPAEAVERVKKVVPKGWAVSASEEAITIRRDKKVGVYNPNGRDVALDAKPPPADRAEGYEIVLWFRPAMGREEYDRQAAVNARIDMRLEKLRNGMRAAKIAHKFDSWLPDTLEQKKLVAEYRGAQLLMPTHRLPDLYTGTHCIDVEDSLGHFMVVADAAEAKECAAVLAAVRGLFKAYKTDGR